MQDFMALPLQGFGLFFILFFIEFLEPKTYRSIPRLFLSFLLHFHGESTIGLQAVTGSTLGSSIVFSIKFPIF